MRTSKMILGFAGLGLTLVVGCAGAETDDTEAGAGAQTAAAAPSTAQKAVDDRCFVAYAQAAGVCNQNAGEDDDAFTSCLVPVKAELVTCCKDGGSPSCADDAAPPTAEQAKDDACFLDYTRSASSCNQSAGDNDEAFTRCLTPVKAALTTCCASGGSPSCADDAR